MDEESSLLCNCVVNFLLEENYLLSEFELLHELLEDGRNDQAIQLKQFFSDPSRFPPDQISHFNSYELQTPRSLLEEKESLEEKLAVSDNELRLAQEDILKLKAELQKKLESNLIESSNPNISASENNGSTVQPIKKGVSFSVLGPLKDNERLDIDCAVKEYLLLAGYRSTAMTFYEEKIAMLRENESVHKENDLLKKDKQSLLKIKEMSDTQVAVLTKSFETLQKDIKDRENLVQDLKKTLESQRTELNDCRAEITSLKCILKELNLESFLWHLIKHSCHLYPS